MQFAKLYRVDHEAKVRGTSLSAWFRKRFWFILVVVVPTILAIFYYGLIASDIYVSESRFVVKSPDEKRPQLSTLANIIQTTGLSSGQEQANQVLEFVRSRDALRALEAGLDVKSKFSSDQSDFISGFPGIFKDDSFENLYKYYTHMVSAVLDTQTGTAVLTVKAFRADDALRINGKLLELSEAMVNRLNARAQTRAIAEAQRQVAEAATRAKEARTALMQYRNAQDLIDPARQAGGVIEIAETLVGRRAALQAQLDLMQRLTPRNPSIPALRNQISAISTQIATQSNRVAGSTDGIASKLGRYEDLFVEQQFATESLTAANAALVQARSEAQRQQFYLERIVDPNRPDMPVLPYRILGVIVVAAVTTCLYFVGWMLIVGILEHAPEDRQ